jgi:hypothetical protein
MAIASGRMKKEPSSFCPDSLSGSGAVDEGQVNQWPALEILIQSV